MFRSYLTITAHARPMGPWAMAHAWGRGPMGPWARGPWPWSVLSSTRKRLSLTTLLLCIPVRQRCYYVMGWVYSGAHFGRAKSRSYPPSKPARIKQGCQLATLIRQ